MSQVDLSVVVLSWNTQDVTRACLRALQQDATPRSREVIVVDNASRDGSAAMIAEEFPGMILIRNEENLLYSGGNNQGAQRGTGRYLCLLNSDTEVKPGALDKLQDFLESNSDYGAVGPKLLNMDGSVQRICGRIPHLLIPFLIDTSLGRFPPGSWILRYNEMRSFDHLHSRDVQQPPGACFMMNRAEYLSMGGLDPGLPLFFNDVDICRRLAKRNRRIRYLADAEVFHHHGVSVSLNRSNLPYLKDRARYFRKHFGLLGRAWMRMVLLLWTARVWAGIRLGPKKPPEKAEAVAKLRDHFRGIWAA